MSESLFGRIFDSIGSSSSDLLLKTKGQVKVKYGNKYIDLIKDGNINYPKETIQKLINENVDSKIQKQEVQLDTNVTDLAEQIKKAKNDLSNDIYSESLARQWAIQDIIGGNDDVFNPDDLNSSKLTLNSLGSKIIEEITRSTKKDEDTQKELTSIKNGIGLDAQGKYVQQTESVYIKEATSVVDSINILDEKLSLQSENSANSESDLSSKITACETNISAIKNDYLKSSDKTELNTAITNENTRAITAEAQLQNSINQEIKDRGDAITEISGQISKLTLPTNVIMLFYGDQVPEGWIVCDGNNNTPILNSDIDNLIYIMKQG